MLSWILRIRLCLFAAAMLSGCGTLARRAPFPDDPLLVSKKPVEGKSTGTVPVMVAYAEPQMPILPSTALVASSVSPQGSGLTHPAPATSKAISTKKPESLMESPRQGSPSQLPDSTDGSRLIPAMPVSRQKSLVSYGHAPNYGWLQGIVGPAEGGGLELRYSDLNEEDPLGGKVLLEGDPRLVQVKIGDVIRVEGTIMRPAESAHLPREPTLARYRLRELWLVGRKNG